VATAISKAESREGLRRVVAEQAALRSVATLVAEGAAPAEVFSSVAQEVARILDVSAVSVVRFESDTWSVVVASVNDPGSPVGTRWPLQGPSLNATVFKTGKPAQIDYSELPGPVAAPARSAGVRVGVGVPIVVEGRVWGMIAVGQRHRRDALPAFAGSYTGRIVLSTASPGEIQARLAAFTELVATAISKAQAHDDLRGLAMEQAALRGVATLVARNAPSTELFESVATEVGKLFGTDMTVVGRYDGDEAATTIGSWSASGGGVPVGTRSAIGGHNVLTIVAETGKPARVDGYDDASGEAAEIARRFGWRSSIAAPIVVEDRLWGVMLVASQRPEPFPAGAEERLAAFTDLVATAVSNTQARHALERVAAEQAALRRVATLVAEDAAPAEIFAAVSAEVDRVFLRLAPSEFDVAGVVRFEPGPELVVVGVSKRVEAVPLGARFPPDELFAATRVLRTGRSARIRPDDVEAAGTEVAAFLRHHGYLSQIASPIVVNGRRWGAVSVHSRNELPPDTEERLEGFTGLVATAIADAESSAELAASRRRIVAASDDARRRIERDLHDGAQQRLVSLALAVRVAEFKVPPDFGDLRKELSTIATGLTEAIEGLQELSRGIHPAILTERGIGPALRTLARRSVIPVDLDITTDVRLAEPIEVAAYFVASEAFANAAKHSDASRIGVSLERRHGNLLLSVRDDGVGGADAARGSGIVGLNDRVEALGGRFALESPPGRGTTISVELPIATAAAP
jgi:signal transduction histidine kinase